jgi:vacuolar-type H+-ATPase subunit I/STV1
MQMEKEGFFVEVKDLVQEYVDDRLMLFKLQATEKAAKVSAVLFISIAVGFLSLILFMILTFIAGYYLSIAVDSFPGGFGILAGVYILIILLLVYLHKKFLSKKISDTVVKFSFDTKESFKNEV